VLRQQTAERPTGCKPEGANYGKIPPKMDTDQQGQQEENPGCKAQIIGFVISIIVLIVVNVVINGGISGCQRLVHSKQYSELDDLKPKIEKLRALISERELDLAGKAQIIDSENGKIDDIESKLNGIQKVYPDLRMPESKADAYNALIKKMNSLIANNNKKIEIYEKDRALHLQEIKEVNSYINRANVLGKEIGPTYTVIVGGRSRRR
jgi:hypothetical protein